MVRKYDPIGKFHYMEEGEVQLTPSQKLSILKDDLSIMKLLILIAIIPSSIYSILMIISREDWKYLFIQIGIMLLLYISLFLTKYRIRKIEKNLIVQDVMNT